MSDTQKRTTERSLTKRLEISCARRRKRTTESHSEDEVEKTVDNKTQPSEKLLFVLTFGNKFDSLNVYSPKFHVNALAVYSRASLNGNLY